MPTHQRRRAVLHGPADFVARVRGLLAGEELVLDVAQQRDELAQCVRDQPTAVILVEHAALASLNGDLTSERGTTLPVVALDCPDGASVARALAAGATLGARADAGVEEIRSLVRVAVDGAERQHEVERAREDLKRQQALVMKDDLTAAYNRRFFERSLAEEIERARRYDLCVSLIFMDMDDLRDVNERYGHTTGSVVLREAAARTIRSIRSIDKAVRYGGDEFCIILPETDWRGAREVAERIRRDFESRCFAVEGTGGVTLTASFGIASYPEHGRSKEELVKAADEAMFRIKATRKNGILVAGEGVS